MQFLYPIGLMALAASAVMAVSPSGAPQDKAPLHVQEPQLADMTAMAAVVQVVARAAALRPVSDTILPDTVLSTGMAGPAPFDADAYVVPLNEAVAGHVQTWYANDWWQWLMAAPKGENPQDDPTGRACARDQGEKVWYLAGALDGKPLRRKCSVPEGRALFFPVTAVYDTTAPSRPLTCAEARSSAKHVADAPVALQVTLNGARISSPGTHRIAPETCFDLTARIEGRTGAPMYPSATDGYWMMLRPLPPGRHVISFRAGAPDPQKPFGTMWQDVTYELTVEPAAR